MHLHVHYLPQFVADHELAGDTVVVIDLLRASTTICCALAAGAREVRPFVEVDLTLRAADGMNRADVLLGGERGGNLIEGFDLGNSPDEYTPDRVFGKAILFTTTNGTRAVDHARLARRLAIGAMVNLSALVDAVGDEPHVHLLCAGTGASVTREDLLAAGAMVMAIQAGRDEVVLSEPAESVLGQWQELVHTARSAGRTVPQQLAEELRETPGGKNLLAIGHDHDLVTCAEVDRVNVVPEYDFSAQAFRLP